MYVFWKRFDTKKKALKESAKLRRMGKRARVKAFVTHSAYNHDVFVDLREPSGHDRIWATGAFDPRRR